MTAGESSSPTTSGGSSEHRVSPADPAIHGGECRRAVVQRAAARQRQQAAAAAQHRPRRGERRGDRALRQGWQRRARLLGNALDSVAAGGSTRLQQTIADAMATELRTMENELI